MSLSDHRALVREFLEDDVNNFNEDMATFYLEEFIEYSFHLEKSIREMKEKGIYFTRMEINDSDLKRYKKINNEYVDAISDYLETSLAVDKIIKKCGKMAANKEDLLLIADQLNMESFLNSEFKEYVGYVQSECEYNGSVNIFMNLYELSDKFTYMKKILLDETDDAWEKQSAEPVSENSVLNEHL